MRPRSPREVIEPERLPAPPQRSRSARNPIVVFLNGFLSIVLIGMFAVGAILYWGAGKFTETGPLEEDTTVLITRGMTVENIAEQLTRAGVLREDEVIPDRWIFLGGVWANKSQAKLKAGEYLIPARSSMRDVMDALVQGKSILHLVTVPEGLTSMQIVDLLNADPILTGTLSDIPPEGSLLPESYKFTRGTTRPQMIDRMRKAHDRVLNEVWERRSPDIPIGTPEDLVTLASIIEKETGVADERTRVAAVFINRLQRGMRLQSDPTIIYGIVGGKGSLGRPIRRSEINASTPYNTYVIDGLPPGPIANPGRASLEAAANPSRTDDLFFVANGTGGHAFAETLEEHNRNVAKWRQIERKRREEAEKKPADSAEESQTDDSSSGN